MPDISYTFMIPLMQAFATATHSYGWAIILLTLLIRIIVWPLVSKSTRSMQRMSQLQPAMKAMQEKYKNDPELPLKMAEFYKKNELNPFGGCLPMLIQLPVLFALFATFTSPPFQDKTIPVKISVVNAKDVDAGKVKPSSNPTSSNTAPYLSDEGKTEIRLPGGINFSLDGRLAKFAVQPGEQTVVLGRGADGQPTTEPVTIDFHTIAVAGDPPPNFKPGWKIESDPNGATIDPATGMANFPLAGDVTVEATFPDGQTLDVPLTVEARPDQQNGGFNPFGGGGDPFKSKTAQSTESRTVVSQGKTPHSETVVVTPGSSTITAGARGIHFELKQTNGTPSQLQASWHIVKDTNAATIDANGKAMFPRTGDVVVAAIIPGEAKDDSWYFVSSLGKVAKGMELLDPKNWDVLGMLIAFTVTMYLSQILMVQPTTNLDPEQAAIQKQTQQMMPIMMTAIFFFYALPAGVYLYLVASNVMQTIQTWIIYKTPGAKVVVEGETEAGTSDNNGGKISSDSSAGTIDNGQDISEPKKKAKKKK